MLTLQARVDLGVMAMKRYSCIPQSSSITGASPSDCLVSYPGHVLLLVVVESSLSAEMQLVYSTVPADWAAVSFNM